MAKKKGVSLMFVGLGEALQSVQRTAMLSDEQVAAAMRETIEPIGEEMRAAFVAQTTRGYVTGKTAEQIGSHVEITEKYGVTGFVGVVGENTDRNFIARFVESGTEHVTEFGSWTIPPRPWLRPTWDRWDSRVVGIFAKQLAARAL